MATDASNAVQTEKTENLLAAIAYLLGFLSGFAVLLFVKKNEFVRFHALQSVMTFMALFLLMVAAEFIPVVGAYITAIIFFISFCLWLFLITMALQGKKIKL